MISSSLLSRPPGLGRGWNVLDEGSTISIASEAGRGGWRGAEGPWWHVEHMAEFCGFLLHFSQRRPRLGILQACVLVAKTSPPDDSDDGNDSDLVGNCPT